MKTFDEIYKGNLTWLKHSTIFMTLHGSQLYGTSTPESDMDVKGIAIPPKEYLYGFQQNFEQAIQSEPVDLVIYSLQKFMKLAADCNPNIIELLFADPDKWIVSIGIFKKLYDNRHAFLSMKARHTFAGYAFSQLKRIKSHRSWLLNPMTHKPTREEFGLNNMHKINSSIMGAFDNIKEKHDYNFDGEVMKLLTAEKRYTTALTQYNQYMNWKKNRNPKRALEEEKMGFDGKHAMHLVRLTKMCKEILTTGEVVVSRPDARELLEIRNGKWTYDELINWADSQEKEIDKIYKNSKQILPHSPNKSFLNDLCTGLIEEFYEDNES
jgi:predicted nucleotidyltransferase